MTLSYIDDFFNPAWYEYYFQEERIKGKEKTSDIFCTSYYLDNEVLLSLCEASDISLVVRPDSNNSLKLQQIPLPGFEYYCQYFYNLMVDNTAYKDVAEKQETKEIAELKEKVQIGDNAQKYAGLLSGQFKLFNKMSPTPDYITQLLSERDKVTITHVKGKIKFQEADEDGTNRVSETLGYLSMHSLTPKGEKPIFFIGVTVTSANCKLSLEKKYTMRMTIDMEDKYLHSVTTEKRHLNKKSKFSGNSFNFYACSDEVMQKILQAKDNIVFKFEGYNRSYISTMRLLGFFDLFGLFEKSPVPKTWKDAYVAITER